MLNALKDLLESGDYTIIEDFELPAREARYREIPKFLNESKVGLLTRNTVKEKGGLWHHQSVALERFGNGLNIVISTGTASGKSLIFMSAAFHRVLKRPTERVLVFYPLKALAADQLLGWQDLARRLELRQDFIGRIDGSIDLNKREGILKSSRVVLMTPDVCHAWMMSNLANPTIKDFLRNLGLTILDEAHTLEGVFGSNFSFLFRRIIAARNSLLTPEERSKPLNVIAATATISNPTEHLHRLTGLEFECIGEEDDGSPQSKRRCIHVASSSGDEMNFAKGIQVSLLSNSDSGGFITFVDSRKGVELLAVGSMEQLREILPIEEILPYRAGFASEDRKNIEEKLKKGKLRGVISTSALELGIDIPHLQVGMNIGVPSTRKAYRQRLGRIGRCGPGIFLIVADPYAFTRYGTTFQEYHKMSVEPSYLYLDNRFMQYAHARCLVDELESVGAKEKSTLPTRVDWPRGFDTIFRSARPGGDIPTEFDGIAQLGGDTPQRGYPLRNIGEVNFKITIGEHADPIGDATLAQALRECYPGATYYHLARPYKVESWRTNLFQPFIKVRSVRGATPTKPLIRTWINARLVGEDIIEGHLRKGDNGFIAECQMQITERVEGFSEGIRGSYQSYQERRQTNPNLRPRMRQFRTTGVIICLEEEWFKDQTNKGLVADQLREIFCREYSTLPQDIGTSATNISIITSVGYQANPYCVAIFDQTYGSLRLTERAYVDFAHLLQRLTIAAESEIGNGKEFFKSLVERLKAFEKGLQEPIEMGLLPIITDDGNLLTVFTRGSRVAFRERGQLFTDVEILTPAIMPDGKLMYQIKCPRKYPNPPVKRWVNPEYIESTAAEGEWAYALWNPVTQEYVEEEEQKEGENV